MLYETLCQLLGQDLSKTIFCLILYDAGSLLDTFAIQKRFACWQSAFSYRSSYVLYNTYIISLDDRQEYEVEYEQYGSYPEDGMYFLGLSPEYLYDAVEDESCSDTVGDAVAKSHEDTCEECRNGFVEVIPLDFLECGEHHDTDCNKCRSRRSIGDSAYKGGKESTDCEEDRYDNAGETCAAAGTDACCTFNIGRGV